MVAAAIGKAFVLTAFYRLKMACSPSVRIRTRVQTSRDFIAKRPTENWIWLQEDGLKVIRFPRMVASLPWALIDEGSESKDRDGTTSMW